MRGLNTEELSGVSGGVGEAPNYPGQDRQQTEWEIQQFLDMLQERERQQAVRGR